MQMYAQREYLFAMLTLLLVGTGLYLFASKPAIRGAMSTGGRQGLFTIVLAYHRYRVYQLRCNINPSFERAQSVLLQRSFQTSYAEFTCWQ